MKTKTKIIIAVSVVLGAVVLGVILAQPCSIFGHKMLHTDAKEATCTDDGWNAYDTCEKCGYCTKEIIEAKDHRWNSGTVISSPTYDEYGEKEYTCTVCGDKRTESIPKLERPVEETTYDDDNSSSSEASGWGKCSSCHQKEATHGVYCDDCYYEELYDLAKKGISETEIEMWSDGYTEYEDEYWW